MSHFAYCTLITRASYLPGVIVLAHTLRKHASPYPLVVLYTNTLSSDALRALELEAPVTKLVPRLVDPLLPGQEVTLIAERFADTWTKLRVFQLYGFDRVCYLDADMIIRRNPDHIFDITIPDGFIAANHTCVCNLDNDEWPPSDWTVENCAYTPLSSPTCDPSPVSARRTYSLLNSGMFLFSPSPAVWDRMLAFFDNQAPLSTYKLPDQDFLADFFTNRWKSVGWEFNAIKTMRYWHTNLWADDHVVVLHYIVDKPWAERVDNGVAGYLGKDAVTHTWWWNEWESWVAERQGEQAVELVDNYVAKAKTGTRSVIQSSL